MSGIWKKTPHKATLRIETFAAQADGLDARSDPLMSFGKRIMLVDGDPDTCYLLGMILKLNDFDVVPFTDPEQALASFCKDKYDLLLLDVKVPQMGGFELYKKIKKIDNIVRVCFMTNYRQECLQTFRESFPELAPESLVHKPASGNDLMKTLQGYFGK